MDRTLLAIVAFATGVLLGGLVFWLWSRGAGSARIAAAEAESAVLRERVGHLERADEDNDRTELMLAPLASTLSRMEQQVGVLERDRSAQFGALDARLTEVGRSTAALSSQTASLATALSTPTVRGMWGELHLRRVLEVAGLSQRCDMDEQVSRVSRHGQGVRPDAVVHLPGDRHVVVDAKAPMTYFLAAAAEGVGDVERSEAMQAHAQALRRHVDTLAGKQYWTAFEQAPELVVCFVPSEALLTQALAHDPGLYEAALARKVVIATPGTLFVLLKTVATMWQQESLHTNAQELLRLGSDLYQRLGTLGRHVSAMGASITKSVENYNRLVGSLETRVLVTARRMHELDLVTEPPPELAVLSASPRSLSVPELFEEVIDRPAERDAEFTDQQRTGSTQDASDDRADPASASA